jgi:hypothetical protein
MKGNMRCISVICLLGVLVVTCGVATGAATFTSPLTKKITEAPRIGYSTDGTGSNEYALGTFSVGAGASIREGGKLVSYSERSFASGKVKMHFSFRYLGGSR